MNIWKIMMANYFACKKACFYWKVIMIIEYILNEQEWLHYIFDVYIQKSWKFE